MAHIISPIATAYDWTYPICNEVEINPRRAALNEVQRSMYDQILPKLRAGELEVSLGNHSCSPEEVRAVYHAVVRDHPELYYLLDSNRSINSTLTLSEGRPKILTARAGMSASQRANTWRAMTRTIRAIVRNVPAHWGDYQRLLYLYEWFALNVVYDKAAPRGFSADGPLAWGRAVCAGISEAFALVARAVGIPAGCVSGTSKDGNGHRLNIVLIKGIFTYVDCTNAHAVYCDDTGKQVRRGKLPQLTYRYLCFSGQELERYVSISPGQKVPLCYSESFDWFNLNNQQLGPTFYPERLDSTLYSALASSRSSVEVKYATRQALRKAERWVRSEKVYHSRFGDALKTRNQNTNASIAISSDEMMRTLTIAW